MKLNSVFELQNVLEFFYLATTIYLTTGFLIVLKYERMGRGNLQFVKNWCIFFLDKDNFASDEEDFDE